MPRNNTKQIAEIIKRNPKLVNELNKQERQLMDLHQKMMDTIYKGTGIPFGFLSISDIGNILNEVAMKKVNG